MKFNKVDKATLEKAKEILEKAEDKSQAILEAVELINEAANKDLIEQILKESANANAKAQNFNKLGLRQLSDEENKFYDALKTDVRQAIDGKQIDMIPTTIIDNTLADVKKASDLLSLVSFAPADVKKWLSASKTGTYAWGKLTDAVKGELSVAFEALNIELGKITAYLVLPKAIRDLSNPFVDKYFTAILAETMNDGLEYAFLLGTGVEQPIGVFRKINEVETNGEHKMKTKNSKLTEFTPKGLAPVKTQLSHGGNRAIPSLALVCNPNDEAAYVDPALYVQALAGGYVQVSKDKIRTIPTANCPQGQAGLFIDKPDYYTMGLSAIEVKEYDQTKAMDDADVIIAKAYGNGRAVDDDVCFYFDPTKLVEYVPKYFQTNAQTQATE